jgi:NADPH:quinone reductase-like Zn-dependent oxidoreductase
MALTNRGIVRTSTGKTYLTSLPLPKIPDGFLLLKTAAVAINPTDNRDEGFPPGLSHTVWGTDGAGTVVDIGKNVTKIFKTGDRVASFSHGGKAARLRRNGNDLSELLNSI